MIRATIAGFTLVVASLCLPLPATAASCSSVMTATRTRDDRTQVTVMINGDAATSAGTLIAYGGDIAWSGSLPARPSGVTFTPWKTRWFSVRSGGPIEGLEFRPEAEACSLHAVVRASSQIRAPVINDVIVLSHSAPDELARCATPFVDGRVLRAWPSDVPPMAQQQGIGGRVVVLVALDDHGTQQRVSVARSPSAILNSSALNAARQSTYSPAIFRCEPVAGAVEFYVDYLAQ